MYDPLAKTLYHCWDDVFRKGDTVTQLRLLQMKRSWMSTFIAISSLNPRPPRSNLTPYRQSISCQPEMEIPKVKQSFHWTTIHLCILRRQRKSPENWLALRCFLDRHGSSRLNVASETAQQTWPSLHNWLSKMRTFRIWFPSTLQLQSPMIMRMASTIQSLTHQSQSLLSLTNGIWWCKHS